MTLIFSSLMLSSPLYRQTLQSNMASSNLIQSFLQQTIYLGMADDSVCNPAVLFLLLRPTKQFFSVAFWFFLVFPLWYVGVEKVIWQREAQRERDF